ncbi:hypothetical protein K490DRAFT_30993 [Saccharata proteae CBS 121410]|uniref:GDP-mannose transporter n=1 Tax=Saccharata proteae CBS 121410 TaxID=1314787 RepID=A0A9P4LZP5_9PEZI|nr:hypothetical protein K490DRAFT_30993 [Saccharata proteae CBS 121410]
MASAHFRQPSNGSAELQPGAAYPLVDISRSPSPYPRSRSSAATSEADDDEYAPTSLLMRPLVAGDIASGGVGSWRRALQTGGLGGFFFGDWIGWQVYVGLLVFWVAGCEFGLLLMNRFVLLSKCGREFPYPLTMTWIQLCLCHVLLWGLAGLTRLLERPLRRLGLDAMVAPSRPISTGPPGFRGAGKSTNPLNNILHCFSGATGGIAGGGIFEFEWKTARKLIPLAVVYFAKVVLSNISFAYAAQETYSLARIGVVPLSLLFASLSTSSPVSSSSTSTMSSALTATAALLIACLRPGVRVTWESIVSGIFSSLFVALYPALLLRCYHSLIVDIKPSAAPYDIPTGFATAISAGDALGSSDVDLDEGGAQPSTRAYWRLLHYLSLLTLAIMTPVVVISGELSNIHHNCYFLDVPFFWFLILCGGIGSVAVFSSTLLLAQATSPLTVNVLGLPRGAWQLAALSKFRLPVHSWLGVGFCWVASLWFLLARRQEGRHMERMRLEGGR